MTKQILAFLFCFTRELNLYTPLTFSLRPPIHPYRFSSLVKQNKKAKICFVIYIAGEKKLLFYIYAVIVKQKKKALLSTTSPRPPCCLLLELLKLAFCGDIETASSVEAPSNMLDSFLPVDRIVVRTHFQVKIYQLILLSIHTVW